MTELTNLSVEVLLLLTGPASNWRLTARKRDVWVQRALQSQGKAFIRWFRLHRFCTCSSRRQSRHPLKGSGDSLDWHSHFQLSVFVWACSSFALMQISLWDERLSRDSCFTCQCHYLANPHFRTICCSDHTDSQYLFEISLSNNVAWILNSTLSQMEDKKKWQ